MTDSIIQHLLENKKHTANHRNSKKTTTFVFNKCSVTYLRKCPIIQHLVSDSGHSQKRLKESGTTHICKAMKYTDLHLSPHSVYLSKQRLYRLKWTVTDNQWCKYAVQKKRTRTRSASRNCRSTKRGKASNRCRKSALWEANRSSPLPKPLPF